MTTLNMSKLKSFLYIIGWIFAIAQAVVLAVIVLKKIEHGSPEWALYLNVKLPQAWFNLCVFGAVFLIFDWITPKPYHKRADEHRPGFQRRREGGRLRIHARSGIHSSLLASREGCDEKDGWRIPVLFGFVFLGVD